MTRPELPLDFIRSFFDYNPETGDFVWRRRPLKPICGQNPLGYRSVTVGGWTYLVHRLIWVWVHGSIDQKKSIDHLNGDPSDNRLINLRLVTHAENLKNRKKNKNNRSGISGVHWQESSQRWYATCFVNGKAHNLSLFADKHEAGEVVRRFRLQNGFTARHGT